MRRPSDETLWRIAMVLALVLLTVQFCQPQPGFDWRDAF